jgi:hypothetical protein
MIDEKEIIEGDMLIADFMELVRKKPDHFFRLHQWWRLEPNKRKNTFMGYDNSLDYYSYDMLMPVVERIKKVSFELWDSNKIEERIFLKVNIWSCEVSWVDEETGEYPICETIVYHTFLESLYKAVVEFIKWYNSKNK